MSTPPSPPNIILIMTDQQRGDCLGCAGHPILETPNLDALASEGTRFRCAYAAVPACIPARASFLTGMNQWHTHDVNAWRSPRSAIENQRARACYYGSITFIDHQIGRFLRALRRRSHDNLWSNTWIIFHSDHGDMLGDHHLWRKTYAYEGSVHIPMIVRPPANQNTPRGQVRNEVVELRDVMPTVLEAAQVPVPDSCDGASMLPLIDGKDCPWRTYFHGEHSICYHRHQAMQYLTDGREKYIYLPYLGVEQLFDLANAPTECHDLAGQAQHADRLRQWRQRLVNELSRRDDVMVRDGQLLKLNAEQNVTSPHYGQYFVAP